jgi:aspartate aminotransferase
MASGPVSQRIDQLCAAFAPFDQFFAAKATWPRRANTPVYDFVFGNPHEMPIPAFVEALTRWSVPRDQSWYAYKMSQPESRAIIAESLRARYRQPFAPEDIFLTNGAFAAISVTLNALVDPGDEVIFISPSWFFYEALIIGSGARPVRVHVEAATFDLDVAAIAAAITRRTRAVIINSPHNPTGKIYPSHSLERLAQLLAAESERIDRPIYLLSDEAYSRIVFDGQTYESPTTFYANSLLIYTYGKTLLAPGQRIGYIALPTTMVQRKTLAVAIETAQLITGYAYPNALLQHALADLENITIDIAHLQRKRDLLVGELRAMGYEVSIPQGTFYLFCRSPWADDYAFAELLAWHGVYCLPGTVVEAPGYFRLSLTANDQMIEGALPGFAAAMQQAHSVLSAQGLSVVER